MWDAIQFATCASTLCKTNWAEEKEISVSFQSDRSWITRPIAMWHHGKPSTHTVIGNASPIKLSTTEENEKGLPEDTETLGSQMSSPIAF